MHVLRNEGVHSFCLAKCARLASSCLQVKTYTEEDHATEKHLLMAMGGNVCVRHQNAYAMTLGRTQRWKQRNAKPRAVFIAFERKRGVKENCMHLCAYLWVHSEAAGTVCQQMSSLSVLSPPHNPNMCVQ